MFSDSNLEISQMGAVQADIDPISAESWLTVWTAMRPLDRDWTASTATDFLTVLQEIPSVGSFGISIGACKHVFAEECIHGWTGLLDLAFEWLHCRDTRQSGRQAIRAQISGHFQHIPAPAVANAIKSEEVVPKLGSISNLDAILTKAGTRATQISRNFHISKFDGLRSAERYLVFRHEVQTMMQGSVGDKHSYVASELLLQHLSGVALTRVRELIHRNDLYSMGGSRLVDDLWNFLDQTYLTSEAIRHVNSLLVKCVQGNGEDVYTFTDRFRRLVQMQQPPIPDTAVIIQFTNSLRGTAESLAVNICDIQAPTDSFDQYVLCFKKHYDSMSRLSSVLPSTAQQRAVAVNATDTDQCYRCGQLGHSVDKCSRRVKYPCRHCKKLEHFSDACPSKPHEEAHLRAPTYGKRQPGAYQRQRLDAAAVTAPRQTLSDALVTGHDSEESESDFENAVIELAAASIAPDDLVDRRTPIVELECQAGHETVLTTALLDTGAAASFISFDEALRLRKLNVIRKGHIHSMQKGIDVIYGNSTTEVVDSYCDIFVKTDTRETIKISVFIAEKSNPKFILGRPALRALNLMPASSRQAVEVSAAQVSSTTDSIPCLPILSSPPTVEEFFEKPPLIQVVHSNNKERLMARLPLLEQAFIQPFRAKRRQRTQTDHLIIHERLERMREEGKAEQVQSPDCHVVSELVLVDKKPQLGVRSLGAADLHTRYRITLDLRPLNALAVKSFGSCMGFVRNSVDDHLTRTEEHQAQVGALESLSWLPPMNWFFKIDLSDAFSSVLLPPSLRGLFCYEALTPDGIKYYRLTVLPQGWKYSPLLFSSSVSFVLQKCTLALAKIGAVARHFQDDITGGGCDRETAASAMKIVIDEFVKFGFHINPDKCVLAEEVTFCGYSLTKDGIKPEIKSALTDIFRRDLWAKFQADDSKTSHIRSWVGIFNYFRAFMGSKELGHLQSLYSLTKCDTSPAAFLDPNVELAFNALFTYIAGDVPRFPCGRVPNTALSVVIVDANRDSWAGLLLRVVSQGSSGQFPDPTFLKLFDEFGIIDPTLVPVRMTGGVFNEAIRRQSSTLRERYSQLLAIEDFKQYLYGRVVVVTDNSNSGKNWHKLDDTINYLSQDYSTLTQGSNLFLFEAFQSIVSAVVWCTRDCEAMRLIDHLARILVPRVIKNGEEDSSPEASKRGKVRPAAPVRQAILDSKSTDATVTVASAQTGTSEESNRRVSMEGTVRPTAPVRQAILDSMSTDATIYQKVQMKEIYMQLTGALHADPKSSVAQLSRRFWLDVDTGLLYHIRAVGSFQVYVPKGVIRAQIIHEVHASNLGLHRGHTKTLTCLDGYWWPSKSKDVLVFIKTCAACVKSKARYRPFQGDLSSVSKGISEPFRHWILDYAGPFRMDNTDTNYRYVLIAVDSYSSWAELIPTRDATSETTCNAIIDNIICRYGFSEVFFSDRGSAFLNQLSAEIGRRFNFRFQYSSSFTPRVQGKAEALVKKLKSCFRSYSEESDEKSIFEVLPFVQLLHNSSLRSGTPCSPFEVVYGISPNVSPFAEPISDNEAGPDPVRRIYDAREKWNVFRNMLFDRSADQYASRSPPIDFVPGDACYRVFCIPGVHDVNKVTGPHQIVSKTGTNQFWISDYSYPIPAFQLQPAPTRPPELDPDQRPPTPPTASLMVKSIESLIAGDLLMFERYEEDSSVAYDCAKFLERDGEEILCEILWYDRGIWRPWTGMIKKISPSQVCATGFILNRGRIPKSITKSLLSGI